ncbi:putative het-domain-containing protein [Botrytis fragariae]|uniref:Putative het-domain-containing protein n=1 Tax=Botrytis fragariae TaxID=1964551 RepID=A0A8H6AUK3_9HELO|nr:putative het-domain-containing protein [Botrytis fragariae]KAF5873924.1 putative het-domain-containing protein [Botrytis fragariae]
MHDQKFSLEFENGTILPWPREADFADLAQKVMLTGNVRFIHVFGWFTHLPVPISSNPEQSRQVCGSYRTTLVTEHWLLRLARERRMNVTDNEEYVFKAWVYASGDERHHFLKSYERVFHMMLLGETSDSNTFERINVCTFGAQLEWEKEEWREKSMEDIAKRLGWEMEAFKLA